MGGAIRYIQCGGCQEKAADLRRLLLQGAIRYIQCGGCQAQPFGVCAQ